MRNDKHISTEPIARAFDLLHVFSKKNATKKSAVTLLAYANAAAIRSTPLSK